MVHSRGAESLPVCFHDGRDLFPRTGEDDAENTMVHTGTECGICGLAHLLTEERGDLPAFQNGDRKIQDHTGLACFFGSVCKEIKDNSIAFDTQAFFTLLYRVMITPIT